MTEFTKTMLTIAAGLGIAYGVVGCVHGARRAKHETGSAACVLMDGTNAVYLQVTDYHFNAETGVLHIEHLEGATDARARRCTYMVNK